MKRTIILLTLLHFFVGCGNNSTSNISSVQSYIQNLEVENNISYEEIMNTRGSYITSMCYTKTIDQTTNTVFNPCYSCHTKGKIPNYYNDTNLQMEYNFPAEVMKNPFMNLFKDRSTKVAFMTDSATLAYVRQSNYLNHEGEILPTQELPIEWKGYRPDCYFHFDDDGFDKDPEGKYTGWRAFRYYPFLGTFWPTNGSTDDVLIRLDTIFRQDEKNTFSKKIYSLNLAIVEALIKQKEIVLPSTIDEKVYGVDLNSNGLLDTAFSISPMVESYVGLAKLYLGENKVHLAQGLFPENTEFLHSVRYIDWDDDKEQIALSARMKELRYAKKYAWKRYGEIERAAQSEFLEALALDNSTATMAFFKGNYEEGLRNEIGWVYQGFIENKSGILRPQTHEETIACMGCHSHLGATTDSTFAFARKFEGSKKDENDYGWNHWSQKGLDGVKEPLVEYLNDGKQYEYSFYLQNNHSANEFRDNDEVQRKFFDANGSIKKDILKALNDDITLLLFPSKERALSLNKGYKAIVEEQSYIYGRDTHIKPLKHLYKVIKEGQVTGIKKPIVRP
ncbi:hypothetical protein MN086_02855 [Sulfurovum sp. XGS-02]|uniref:hypothetical protein n=1 Tax=Sulfurovum sp. XGS-02 TaxID=2925411 RepID=UPI00205054FA|nr:hypothetical protein [Sulfurovum sp. XGS-02]UPT78092.1 hypothetical protein MN086_02855 [Sulfurovum sp. XGS-02]